MAEVSITLTDEECDFLACLIYHVIGGSPDGPRRNCRTIASKIQEADVNRFDVEIKADHKYVVVREPVGKRRVSRLRDVM